MTDFSHLAALETRLSHERVRLDNSKSKHETAARYVTVRGIEREIAAERFFLGLDPIDETDMSDDELLAALVS
jgi:hypothetical protein